MAIAPSSFFLGALGVLRGSILMLIDNVQLTPDIQNTLKNRAIA
ncbi:MAG: hypothetical protein V7K21_07830 [Nostoc sp.]